MGKQKTDAWWLECARWIEEEILRRDISDDYDDDRYGRWLEVNGIVFIGSDGRYFRRDGSEVISGESYPYDAKLTPYTQVSGNA